ncbi:MAG: aldo/keto reductase [Solirubrobacteraceae bacterium]|nr:aldo/keto reductase [Solirubrobacteraceae bacterium]
MTAKIATRSLGTDGPVVGAIGLGCMGMTWAYDPADRDEARSIAAIHRALDLGVTLIDTADMYGPFTNEELVGKALTGRRDEAVLATKVGLIVESTDPIEMRRNGHPDHIAAGIDASLERLGVDHVDLYQLHRVDPTVPVEETWGAMAEVVRAGKARAIGMSEATLDELRAAHAIHPVATLQSEFSLWTREPLDDVIPWCRANGAGFLPFSPLGRGFLTGALSGRGGSFASGDFRSSLTRFQGDAMDANQAIVDRVQEVAARHGAKPSQVALAWVLSQGDFIVPIPGTRRPERVEENAGGAGLTVTDEDLRALDGAPTAVGERYGTVAP